MDRVECVRTPWYIVIPTAQDMATIAKLERLTRTNVHMRYDTHTHFFNIYIHRVIYIYVIYCIYIYAYIYMYVCTYVCM